MSKLKTPLPSVLNFRDVGQTVNEFDGSDKLETGKLYRSARPDGASATDRRRLLEEFGVRTIIDLRTDTERIQRAQKYEDDGKPSASTAPPDIKAPEPFKIAGIDYREINFNGRGYGDSLLKHLTWWQYLSLVFNMVIGRRIEGIRILGENVMCARGLIGLAVDSVEASTKEVKEVFDVFSDPEAYPILVHCTQGKDRTGLVVLLLLSLLNCDIDTIHNDYMLSDGELEPERGERMEEIEKIGLSEEFTRCDPKLVMAVVNHIEQRYGSVETYLSGRCLVDGEAQERCRRILNRYHAISEMVGGQ